MWKMFNSNECFTGTPWVFQSGKSCHRKWLVFQNCFCLKIQCQRASIDYSLWAMRIKNERSGLIYAVFIWKHSEHHTHLPTFMSVLLAAPILWGHYSKSLKPTHTLGKLFKPNTLCNQSSTWVPHITKCLLIYVFKK